MSPASSSEIDIAGLLDAHGADQHERRPDNASIFILDVKVTSLCVVTRQGETRVRVSVGDPAQTVLMGPRTARAVAEKLISSATEAERNARMTVHGGPSRAVTRKQQPKSTPGAARLQRRVKRPGATRR